MENSIDNMKNTKTIKHGEWNFEYGAKNNIYNNNIDSFDNKIFNYINNAECTNINNSVKIYETKDCLTEKDLDNFRRAALIHRIVRKKALIMLYDGASLAKLVETVEQLIIKLCQQDSNTYFLDGGQKNIKKIGQNKIYDGQYSGIAFPVGVNINNIVAHDSKTTTVLDDRTFCNGDVVKIDIGVHIDGRIIDSAFTHIVTNKPGIHDSENIYNSVLDASKESVYTAIKMSGPDQRLDEMSETIDEIIRSFEVDIGGDTIPIKPVNGIGGHNIKQYMIHGGKLILSEPDYEIQGDQRMEEDEIYAIETYASTGYGVMTQNNSIDRCTHYMETDEKELEINKAITKKDKKYFRQTEFYGWLKTRKGLPFSSSWINNQTFQNKIPKLEKAFKLGIPSGQIMAFPPLCDEENSVVAQFEHTIHVNDGTVEIFSLGEDY